MFHMAAQLKEKRAKSINCRKLTSVSEQIVNLRDNI